MPDGSEKLTGKARYSAGVLEYKKQKDSSKLHSPEKEFYDKLSILDIYE